MVMIAEIGTVAQEKTNLEQSHSCNANNCSSSQECLESEGSLSCWQEPTMVPVVNHMIPIHSQSSCILYYSFNYV